MVRRQVSTGLTDKEATLRLQKYGDKALPEKHRSLLLELTQVFGTLTAVYGWFMEPIGWIYALAIWGYAILWFVINDLMKVQLARLLDLRLAWKKKPIPHKQKGK